MNDIERWSRWHSIIGVVIVAALGIGLWTMIRRPDPPASPELTTIERKAQRHDELCRLVDTETRIAQLRDPDQDALVSSRAVLEVMRRFDVICRWDDYHPKHPPATPLILEAPNP